MLDIRVESFLSVCKNKSYTKAAVELCITQPAVTQHIKSLEKQYNCRLLDYQNRQLRLTKAGQLFYKYSQNAKANEKIIAQQLEEVGKENKTLKFAATLTIGEFTIAPILGDFIKTFKEYDITMYVDNTEKVLKMLQEGDISFAMVEGLFNKADYENILYKNADFILVSPVGHPLVSKDDVCLDDLKNETIIVREKGSGSREVLERGLFDSNHTLKSFKNIIEIGNVNVIKEMVKSGLGLSFMYSDAALGEIQKGQLVQVKISDFVINREFNFIYLKNHISKGEMEKIFNFFKNRIL
jgi:LysR family transcriptional regulator, transcriptional activator of the cysJI operon